MFTFVLQNDQITKKTKKMNLPNQQCNLYNLTNANGSIEVDRYFFAPNIKEATKYAKKQWPHAAYFGKVKRCYNGGVRG